MGKGLRLVCIRCGDWYFRIDICIRLEFCTRRANWEGNHKRLQFKHSHRYLNICAFTHAPIASIAIKKKWEDGSEYCYNLNNNSEKKVGKWLEIEFKLSPDCQCRCTRTQSKIKIKALRTTLNYIRNGKREPYHRVIPLPDHVENRIWGSQILIWNERLVEVSVCRNM